VRGRGRPQPIRYRVQGSEQCIGSRHGLAAFFRGTTQADQSVHLSVSVVVMLFRVARHRPTYANSGADKDYMLDMGRLAISANGFAQEPDLVIDFVIFVTAATLDNGTRRCPVPSLLQRNVDVLNDRDA
jgi:hypothetical protein